MEISYQKYVLCKVPVKDDSLLHVLYINSSVTNNNYLNLLMPESSKVNGQSLI